MAELSGKLLKDVYPLRLGLRLMGVTLSAFERDGEGEDRQLGLAT